MDANDLYIDLGKRIRARRKAKHMTLTEMASALNKSVATISKYESGDIAIGVDVLLDICRVLNIDVATLLPGTSSDDHNEDYQKYERSFHDTLYIYWYNKERKRVCLGVLKNDKLSMKSTLYFIVDDVTNIYKCAYIYSGNIVLSDTSTVYLCKNAEPPFDLLMIRVPAFNKAEKEHIGLMSTISILYQSVALKVLISEVPIHDNDRIVVTLELSPDELKDIKRTNFFTVW